MYRFEVQVQACPAAAVHRRVGELEGDKRIVLCAEALRAPTPMAVSFEEAADHLQRLPRLFFEPDGSFVWVGIRDATRWQVDGVLYDRDGRLIYAELKGQCPPEAFDRLLSALGWPATPLVFQLVWQGIFVDETEFRRLAAASGGCQAE